VCQAGAGDCAGGHLSPIPWDSASFHMNQLQIHNAKRRQEVEVYRDEHVAAHQARSYPNFRDYPLPRLKARISEVLSERWGKGRLEPQFDLIDRETFGGDLALKLPQLLKDGGPKNFIKTHVPWILEVLNSGEFAGVIVDIQVKGMYINLTLSDRWMLDSAQVVADLAQAYGHSDLQRDRTVLIDYSSPNIAKVLHAGHIRSTIIGHVLGNLHEASGGLVYRVNHINDFGGFGFTLEGYRRFRDRFPAEMRDGERLLEIYRIRRVLERLTEEGVAWDAMDASDRELLARYFPEVSDANGLKAASDEFTAASDSRFAALERGEAAEVDLWAQMVAWSLNDFEQFYRSLDIHIDLVLGESFYFQAGDELIDECLKAGTAIQFTHAEADAEIREADALLAKGELKEAEHRNRVEMIRKDIGAVVIPLGDGERYVVRRADGLSIYSTRDLGAIRLRGELFHPTDLDYVVGQEQRVHFSRLFKAAYRIGIATPEKVRFQHIYFGFYVDAQTGRKLSSRNSVANVNHLLSESVKHFRAKSAERGDLTSEELDITAQQLAIGSLVFNDLKQDIKGPVDVDTAAIEATIAGFEKSGGAYVVYTACRARSILRKFGGTLPRAETITPPAIGAQEAGLLLRIQQIPEYVAFAAEQSNPTVLVRHLLDIAAVYNSYYAKVQVISDGVADPARLVFTKAVEQALTNALKICHIECPPKI
jgi:arginyl-tRNA synthetase